MPHPTRLLCIVLVAAAMSSAQTPSPAPLTRAERTNFEETSRYEDVRTFIDALAAGNPRLRVETFGTSEEGRALPLLVIGDPPQPDSDRSARRPVVFVMANIHAGEVEGKEALLHLARRFTRGDLQSLTRAALLLFAPIYNADGNERISLTNRSEQNGPVAGVGTRENAKGLDLNRDFMKLESVEARGLVSLFTRWDPDVIVDLHTTNGSYHGYHLTYAPALNPNADARIVAFSRERLLPAVREAMLTRHQLRTYYYGNFAVEGGGGQDLEQFAPSETRARAWRTFDHRPRFGNNYVGLRNRIPILSEAYSYLDFPGRVRATEAFVAEIVRFVAGRAGDVRQLTQQADADWTSGVMPADAGIEFAIRPLPAPVDILVGAIVKTPNPRSGRLMNVMVEDAAMPTRMADYGVFAASKTRPVPGAYALLPSPDGLHETIARKLEEHGLAVETLQAPSQVSAEQFTIADLRRATREFQGHREVAVTGRFERRQVTLPAGTRVIRTNQRLGRLAFYLLEPESDDSLATWNLMDAALQPGAVHPVLKLR